MTRKLYWHDEFINGVRHVRPVVGVMRLFGVEIVTHRFAEGWGGGRG